LVLPAPRREHSPFCRDCIRAIRCRRLLCWDSIGLLNDRLVHSAGCAVTTASLAVTRRSWIPEYGNKACAGMRRRRGSGTKSRRKKAGSWLKELRSRAGLSQIDLADRLGLKYYSYISQIENGFSQVPLEKMEPWAKLLSVDPSFFAKRLISIYDPKLYQLLYGEKPWPYKHSEDAPPRQQLKCRGPTIKSLD
jgi:transcriptional regulator with XRE-family HTH domain